ncbi:diguanylate cyclase [Permianibacter sp. IMCC34836]|uniref:diguanylate cyclase n=1 Tax=Permianibacter fluminis TaxID=2738515 RepID=UPI00155603AA|nr:diguanylate cyclase [Permianibacter fluminis]NQD36616.1 diguanylate cyclase [Permianibacter fluminis]
MTFSTRKKLFLSHFLAIVLVSGSIGSYFYNSAIESLLGSLQTRLKYSAALLSNAVTPADLDQILTPADKTKPAYQSGIARLRELVASNPDIAFIYVTRRDGAQIKFVLDSDPDDPAQPGEVYLVDAPALLAGFEAPSCDRELIHDKWGTFMSGYAPIRGSNGRYAIGIDMRADEVERKLNALRRTGAFSLVLSVLMALLFGHLLSRSFLRRIDALHARCLEVSQSGGSSTVTGGDELDQLTVTFNDMMRELRQSQAELEQRVERRTAELQDANRQLQAEISERERMAKLLEQTARTDFLTKLINRRAMAQSLQTEVARLERANSESGRVEAASGTFSMVLVDIDHFKNINDQFGHDIGDEVLKALARAFEASVREQDIVARWGGEEFLILLPNTGQADAVEQAERLRQLLDSDKLRIDRYPHRVTASFGVSEYSKGQSVESMLKQADVALYQAKAQGRNQVRAISS